MESALCLSPVLRPGDTLVQYRKKAGSVPEESWFSTGRKLVQYRKKAGSVPEESWFSTGRKLVQYRDGRGFSTGMAAGLVPVKSGCQSLLTLKVVGASGGHLERGRDRLHALVRRGVAPPPSVECVLADASACVGGRACVLADTTLRVGGRACVSLRT